MATIGSVTIGMKVDTKQFDKQIEYIEEQIEEIKTLLEEPGNLSGDDLDKYNVELEKLKNKLVDLKKKKQQYTQQPWDEKGFNGISGVIKKITKIGLGLIGLRTGIALLRSSIRTLASENEEIETKINTIKSVIANALAPVVQAVVNLFAKLITYVGYILKAWFGLNVFAANTANNTKKMKNNLGGANKEATKLKRTLAGFDEMNILQKDGSTSTGGGGGGVANDIDMSMFDNIAIPEWVQWIADNKDTILTVLGIIGGAIATAFAIGKIVEFAGAIKAVTSTMAGLMAIKIVGFLGGVATAVYGLYMFVRDLNNGTLSLEKALVDLGIALTGAGVAMIAFNATNPIGWISLLVGGIMALVGAFSDETKEVKDLTKAKYDLLEADQELSKASDELISATENEDKARANLKKTAKELKMGEQELMETGKHLYELVADGEVKYKDLDDTDKKVYQTYVNMISAEQRLEKATKNLTDANIKQTQESLELSRSTAFSTKEFDKYGEAVGKAYEKGAIEAEEAGQRIYEVLNTMDEETRQKFVDNLPNSAKMGMIAFKRQLNTAMDGFSDKLPKVEIKFTANTSSMTGAFNNAINLIKSKINTINMPTLKSANGSVLYGMASGGILGLPRLAPGGIVNNPGPGINYRGANIGERGAEAVVPLTNSQMMNTLGEAIARHINLKAEVPVYLGSRLVAREMRNVNAEDEFAFNGG